jgi:hypothetical protein
MRAASTAASVPNAAFEIPTMKTANTAIGELRQSFGRSSDTCVSGFGVDVALIALGKSARGIANLFSPV